MVVFLIVLVVLTAFLEMHTLWIGLRCVDFFYQPRQTQIEPDTPVEVEVVATNRSLLPVTYLKASLYFPVLAQLPAQISSRTDRLQSTVETEFFLWGRQRVRKTLQVQFSKRGPQVFKGAEVIRGDFLGLHRTTAAYTRYHEVLVYPKLLQDAGLKQALGSYCGDWLARQHLLRDPVLTQGLRDYTGREPMKAISWPHSARRGSLMVREFEFTRDLSCTVLLCANGNGPLTEEALDHCCAMARTVCQTLAENGVTAELFLNAPAWHSADKTMWHGTSGPGNLTDSLVLLARACPGARCTPAYLAREAIAQADTGSAFVVIAPCDTPPLQQALELLRQHTGTQPLVLFGDAFTEI